MTQTPHDHQYRSDAIDVQYSAARCIHAAECVRRLPQVFDTAKRPWVQPDAAPADQVAAIIEHCPSGALRYTRKDNHPQEQLPTQNTITVRPDNALYLHGDLSIESADGTQIEQAIRLALCRCGASQHKPFCDNSHRQIGFSDAGTMQLDFDESQPISAETLHITPLTDGPLLLNGSVEIRNSAGEIIYRGNDTALCRCGGSSHKPFCDGTHELIGFKAD